MSRHFPDWLQAFVDYASYGEAPLPMYFWTGVSTIAGVLRRRVWIGKELTGGYYTWYPNFYIVLVAPPGIVSKSTTANIGMNLLRDVDGVKFGPDIVTSQALVTAFAESAELFEYNGAQYPMSALTLSSSEFGNLLSPQDASMVNLLIDLWDGNPKIDKRTKMSGNDFVQAPWINLIACTTPAWIADNFPESMITGGLVSRMVFVYAEKKAKYVAYPGLKVPKDHEKTKDKLLEDLQHISLALCGPYLLTQGAVAWGEDWYEAHFKSRPESMADDRFGGYIARKQTHLHKLAMILAAAKTDQRLITAEDLATAHITLTSLEEQMPLVFKQVGRSKDSVQMERFLQYVKRRGTLPYEEAYNYIHVHFPGFSEFENMVLGCVQAGQLKFQVFGDRKILTWMGKD